MKEAKTKVDWVDAIVAGGEHVKTKVAGAMVLMIDVINSTALMDMMEEDGIVSKANHVGKRDVL